jgi:hypothetical protein
MARKVGRPFWDVTRFCVVKPGSIRDLFSGTARRKRTKMRAQGDFDHYFPRMAIFSDFVSRMLLRPETLHKLLAGDPDEPQTVIRIREATDDDLLGEAQLKSKPHLHLIRAELFLLFDDLEESHTIVQDSNLDVASYLHGILHRREGDFDNARYWFRRSGTLPFFDELHSKSAKFLDDFAKQLGWDPYLFTYHCEQNKFGDDSFTKDLVQIQRAEFETVLDYTWRQAAV